MMNTEIAVISFFRAMGLVELADIAEHASVVSALDYTGCAITEEDGNGEEYYISIEDDMIKVFGRLITPGTTWMFRDEPDWEVEIPDNFIGFSNNGTPVFSDPAAHPHRPELAAEAISKMTIPLAPADTSDMSQTRHAETIDFGRAIGVNYRTALKPGMKTFMMRRGDREYESLMTIDGTPKLETRLTNVCFWDKEKNRWVYYTNHEGVEDPWPEPGTVRFGRLSGTDQKKARNWHRKHPLICTPEQRKQAEAEGKVKREPNANCMYFSPMHCDCCPDYCGGNCPRW